MATQPVNQSAAAGRAQRLKLATSDVHHRLDSSITSVATFSTLEGYHRFLSMQRQFHLDIDALYGDKALQAFVPGLDKRRRLPLIEADIEDLRALGFTVPAVMAARFSVGKDCDTAAALGWLYVVEGSNLGASLLRKAVAQIGLSDEYGARHLAPAPEGPAAHWRVFTTALDKVHLDPDAEDRVVSGAKAAFMRVQALAEAYIL